MTTRRCVHSDPRETGFCDKCGDSVVTIAAAPRARRRDHSCHDVPEVPSSAQTINNYWQYIACPHVLGSRHYYAPILAAVERAGFKAEMATTGGGCIALIFTRRQPSRCVVVTNLDGDWLMGGPYRTYDDSYTDESEPATIAPESAPANDPRIPAAIIKVLSDGAK